MTVHEYVLGGLLVIDLILTAYGIWSFRSAHKTCHEMLVRLVENHPN